MLSQPVRNDPPPNSIKKYPRIPTPCGRLFSIGALSSPRHKSHRTASQTFTRQTKHPRQRDALWLGAVLTSSSKSTSNGIFDGIAEGIVEGIQGSQALEICNHMRDSSNLLVSKSADRVESLFTVSQMTGHAMGRNPHESARIRTGSTLLSPRLACGHNHPSVDWGLSAFAQGQIPQACASLARPSSRPPEASRSFLKVISVVGWRGQRLSTTGQRHEAVGLSPADPHLDVFHHVITYRSVVRGQKSLLQRLKS